MVTKEPLLPLTGEHELQPNADAAFGYVGRALSHCICCPHPSSSKVNRLGRHGPISSPIVKATSFLLSQKCFVTSISDTATRVAQRARGRMVTALGSRAEAPGSIPESGLLFYLFLQLDILVSSRILSSDRVTNVLRAERSTPNVPEINAGTKGAPCGGPESVSPQRSILLFRRHRRLRR